MTLLPKKLLPLLPRLYETEHIPTNQKVFYIRYYSPFANWEWYVAEYSPEEKIFFGLVRGHEEEWGYFSLEELEQLHAAGLIERDLAFTPTTYEKLKMEV